MDVLSIGAALYLYLIPAIHGQQIAHKDGSKIWLLNIFFGWTVIGWVVAYAWAHHKEQ